MENLELHLFHGFLGLPEDWSMVEKELTIPSLQIVKHSLWDDLNNINEISFRGWSEYKKSQLQNSNKKVAVGYSMGGRLLMHLDLSLFDHVYMIAAHPGLVSEEDKHQRLFNDLTWSDKFLNMEWTLLNSLWNKQEVFAKDKKRPQRIEKDFDREKLSLVMQAFSLSQQEIKDEYILKQRERVTWVVGEDDNKFIPVKKRMTSLLGPDKVVEIPGAGHVCIFDKPKSIAELIEKKYV